MRGLQHNVIEINDTENSDIEKILIFLRHDGRKITVDNTRREAARLLKKVKVERPKRRISKNFIITAVAIARTLAVMIALIRLA